MMNARMRGLGGLLLGCVVGAGAVLLVGAAYDQPNLNQRYELIQPIRDGHGTPYLVDTQTGNVWQINDNAARVVTGTP